MSAVLAQISEEDSVVEGMVRHPVDITRSWNGVVFENFNIRHSSLVGDLLMRRGVDTTHYSRYVLDGMPTGMMGKIRIGRFTIGKRIKVNDLALHMSEHGLKAVDPLTLLRALDTKPVPVPLLTEWNHKDGKPCLLMFVTLAGVARVFFAERSLNYYEADQWFAGIPY